MNPQIDIVIPVYNEHENFEIIYSEIKKSVQNSWRLTIIYDFPEDTTLRVARPVAQKDKRVRIILNESKGVLSAIKTGFKLADAPQTLLLMVDDPAEVVEKIDAMSKEMIDTDSAIVAASRFMRGGSHQGDNIIKKFLSKMAGHSLYFLLRLPIHDATYATKLFRTSFIHSTPIKSRRGFTYALELTLKAHISGENISEVPVKWTERKHGSSRFAFLGWIGSYLYWYLWGIFNYLFFKK
jgi:dolichol-phosphate mannosyltransferase